MTVHIDRCGVCGLTADDPGRIGVEPAHHAKDRRRWERMTRLEQERWSDQKLGLTPCPRCGKRGGAMTPRLRDEWKPAMPEATWEPIDGSMRLDGERWPAVIELQAWERNALGETRVRASRRYILEDQSRATS